MKFKSERYPSLRVRVGVDEKAKRATYVRFKNGELETKDKAEIDALKSLPKERGVKAVGGRSSASDQDGEQEPADKADTSQS